MVTNKTDPDLEEALEISNARLPKGAGDLRIPGNFFATTAKAATMLQFILYHSRHVLYKVLPARHFELWSSFTNCCEIIFAHELNSAGIDALEVAYENFLSEFIRQFPDKNVVYNFHITLHVAENMRVFGPSFTSWWLDPCKHLFVSQCAACKNYVTSYLTYLSLHCCMQLGV